MGKEKDQPQILNTEEEFSQAIQTGISVVHFSADWLEQCTQINDYLVTLAEQFTAIKFYQIPAEKVPVVASKYKVKAAPTTFIFKDNQEVRRVDGVYPSQILDAIKEHTQNDDHIENGKDSIQPIEARLKTLINQCNVMLFMKGTPETPRCGFSKQIIQILNDTGAKYQTFDILSDEDVRQGLKTYSDWPTYPQLYIGGELIGGLDIVKEMLSSGQLQNALKS